MTFGGTKAALVADGRIVLLRRDDLPSIPWPGRVDLPGGGREGNETPVDCTIREVEEETGLRLTPDRFTWARAYSSVDGQSSSWLFVAPISAIEATALRLGVEGQAIWTEPIDDYLARTDAIEPQQTRVRDWISTLEGPGSRGTDTLSTVRSVRHRG